ncbi:MAG: hypothetical protein KGL43_02795 [Burkholderiales bacterium]|nr:hypothetical protein [Burkholderiales bacterium]MDE2395467.1 hypothetical protein [Burkholderiales bacterium]MDE2452498.1 hypothetical protein [Burkholderiales bacterium]
MASLESRLQALERMTVAGTAPLGLSAFYALMEATKPGGGVHAMRDRMEREALTDEDNAAIDGLRKHVDDPRELVRKTAADFDWLYGGSAVS